MKKFRIEIITDKFVLVSEYSDTIRDAEVIAAKALHNNAIGVRIYRNKDFKMIKEYYFANGNTDEIHIHSIMPFA